MLKMSALILYELSKNAGILPMAHVAELWLAPALFERLSVAQSFGHTRRTFPQDRSARNEVKPIPARRWATIASFAG